MARKTITLYLARALERAQCRLLEDGSFAATVRRLRGAIATGPILEACRSDLTEVIEEWVLVRVARGPAVPVLDGATIRVRRAS